MLPCKKCGKKVDNESYSDNHGLCDDCYIEKRTFHEVPIGDNSWNGGDGEKYSDPYFID